MPEDTLDWRPMRIAIDVREACRSRPAGKGVWVRRCTEALLRSREHTFLLFTDCAIPASWRQEHVQTCVFPRGWRWHLAARRALLRDVPDVYLSPTSFLVPALVGAAVPCVPVIHDLIAFLPGAHDRKAVLLERLLLPRVLRHVRRVLCISAATKDDLLRRFPRVSAGAAAVVYAGPTVDDPAPNAPDGRTILSIGTLCPRKNQLRLIRAYTLLPAELRERCRLVLVGGRGWRDGEIVRLAAATDGVEWKGYLSGEERDALLSSCTVFALPSLYEGFGIPVLDALRRGIPVLTSDRGSLPEVAGDAALYVDPTDVRAITDGLALLLTDAAQRQLLRERALRQSLRYSWAKTADSVLRALSQE